MVEATDDPVCKVCEKPCRDTDPAGYARESYCGCDLRAQRDETLATLGGRRRPSASGFRGAVDVNKLFDVLNYCRIVGDPHAELSPESRDYFARRMRDALPCLLEQADAGVRPDAGVKVRFANGGFICGAVGILPVAPVPGDEIRYGNRAYIVRRRIFRDGRDRSDTEDVPVTLEFELEVDPVRRDGGGG